jgi:hypothetical protein
MSYPKIHGIESARYTEVGNVLYDSFCGQTDLICSTTRLEAKHSDVTCKTCRRIICKRYYYNWKGHNV